MLRVEQVTQCSSLEPWRADWSALAARSARGALFETPEWLITWLECFWAPRPICFLFVRDDRRLVGMAPFLDDAGGTEGCPNSLTLPRHDHVPRTGFLLADEDPDAVLDAFLTHLRRTRTKTRITVPCLETGARLWGQLPGAAKRNRLASALRDGTTVPLIRMTSDWNSYLQSRSSHLRSELRRKRRKIEKTGAVKWVIASGALQCESAMQDVLQIEANSWKHDAGTAFTTEPGVRPFYETLTRRAAEAGWLRLHLLYLDSKPIAHIYGAVYGNEYLALKTSYDQNYRDLSPGSVLFEFALQDAFEQGLTAFDLLGVESRWKNELATDARVHGAVCVFSRRLLRCRCCDAYEAGVKPFMYRHTPTFLAIKRHIQKARFLKTVCEVWDTRRGSSHPLGAHQAKPSLPGA